ncbi:hypothetical protein Ppha_1507 [Pelodictyon phaeoclathratiforme BU-1]|uniref:Uncharacterized protein n=1 Tax=Pelodictyon phaeoclathratiforme (strain DSM 5477 / BU-1) TaxID=324925 RepID=B4SA61_PELPB|nr:hypothetical protein Ppha_1507 [Pelodictyon phaeoclathratiforme BU-1]
MHIGEGREQKKYSPCFLFLSFIFVNVPRVHGTDSQRGEKLGVSADFF